MGLTVESLLANLLSYVNEVLSSKTSSSRDDSRPSSSPFLHTIRTETRFLVKLIDKIITSSTALGLIMNIGQGLYTQLAYVL